MISRLGVLFQGCEKEHNKTWCTKAALQCMVFAECALYRVQNSPIGDIFNCSDCLLLGLNGK